MKYLNYFHIKLSLKRKNIKYIKKDKWEIKNSENIIRAITPRRLEAIGP
ncbi:cysteine protease [Edwardsiella tarda]|nr:cysteine protease [Edwardsiella tarda]